MKSPVNRIATSSQHTPGVEGYVFDGADGSQMAFSTVELDAVTAEHPARELTASSELPPVGERLGKMTDYLT